MSQGARQILGDFRARVDFSTRKGLKRREKEVVARCCCLVVWCRLSLLSLFVLPLRLVRLSRSRSRSPIDQAPLLDPSNHPSIPPSFSPFHQLTPIDCPSLALPCPPIPNKHSHIHSLAHALKSRRQEPAVPRCGCPLALPPSLSHRPTAALPQPRVNLLVSNQEDPPRDSLSSTARRAPPAFAHLPLRSLALPPNGVQATMGGR